MKFSDYILIDAINPELTATDAQGVLREMAQSLVDAGGIEQEEYEGIVKQLIKREELGSTSYGGDHGRGIAFPEARHPSVKHTIVALAVSAEGIDFDSIDDEKIHLFFMLIAPTDVPGDFLRVIEHLTRRLKDKDNTLPESLKQAKTREEIFALLEEADSNNQVERDPFAEYVERETKLRIARKAIANNSGEIV